MARPYNALAPLSPKQQAALAQRYVRAQYGPILSQINQGYAQRARAGQASINQGTSALAAALAPQAAQTHQIYGEAQSAQSAIDNAIASKLAAAGQAAQADVGGQLAAAGQAPSPTNLAQVGAGAGAASFGMGSAALSSLVAQGAARENYAAGLPGIAQLGGAYRAQDLALQLEHGRQQDTQSLLAKEPGTIAQVQQQIQQNEFNKAAANLTYGTNVAKLQADTAYKAAKLNTQQQEFSARENRLAQQNQVANLFKQAGLNITKAKLAIAQKHEKAYERGKSGKTGGFTPSQISKIQGNAIEAAKALKHGSQNPYYDPKSDGFHKGVSDKKQRTFPLGKPASARSAFLYLTNHGVPPSLAAEQVGKVYGSWLKKGDKKRLGL